MAKRRAKAPSSSADTVGVRYVESSALIAALLERDADALKSVRTRGRTVTSALTIAEAEFGRDDPVPGLGVAPARCLVVEDSRNGLLASTGNPLASEVTGLVIGQWGESTSVATGEQNSAVVVETLRERLSAGAVPPRKAIDYAEIDLEGKFGVTVKVDGYFVRSNGPVLMKSETYATSGPDSGPDSADGDNFRIRYPKVGKTAVNRLVFSIIGTTGAASLEGGADGTAACAGTDDLSAGGGAVAKRREQLAHALERRHVARPGHHWTPVPRRPAGIAPHQRRPAQAQAVQVPRWEGFEQEVGGGHQLPEAVAPLLRPEVERQRPFSPAVRPPEEAAIGIADVIGKRPDPAGGRASRRLDGDQEQLHAIARAGRANAGDAARGCRAVGGTGRSVAGPGGVGLLRHLRRYRRRRRRAVHRTLPRREPAMAHAARNAAVSARRD